MLPLPFSGMERKRKAKVRHPLETHKQVEQALTELCLAFKLEEPILEFTKVKKASAYYADIFTYLPHKSLIKISEKKKTSRGSYCFSILHEFAHHLNFVKYKERGHRINFYKCLWNTVYYYYNGEVSNYKWNTEYQRIYTWYQKGIKASLFFPLTNMPQYAILGKEDNANVKGGEKEMTVNGITFQIAVSGVTEKPTLYVSRHREGLPPEVVEITLQKSTSKKLASIFATK